MPGSVTTAGSTARPYRPLDVPSLMAAWRMSAGVTLTALDDNDVTLECGRMGSRCLLGQSLAIWPFCSHSKHWSWSRNRLMTSELFLPGSRGGFLWEVVCRLRRPPGESTELTDREEVRVRLLARDDEDTPLSGRLVRCP
ncbi:hypothetical protein CY34DRAFT_187750 [Suillus luteus UH-Slu-Lm8-n1]|uniref:Uncharacterized protein n=1 Tax=Suillus luteus UH-Slu-Lm8-n1 TaxID=930992 RepID=A0A0D0AJI0_9AGAM|nr:hypothetical protein CY34DRAFT_187750 [Suillus luteus UH-Slu-Lm8-n1]